MKLRNKYFSTRQVRTKHGVMLGFPLALRRAHESAVHNHGRRAALAFTFSKDGPVLAVLAIVFVLILFLTR